MITSAMMVLFFYWRKRQSPWAMNNAAIKILDYTCYVSTFWGVRAGVTHIVIASLPYGLLVRISSNPDNTNTKSSVSESKWNKHNRNVNRIAIGVPRSKI